MKILVIGSICTEPVISGSSRLITSYCDFLKDAGHDVHYLLINRLQLRRSKRLSFNKGLFQTSEKWGKKFHLYNFTLLENLYCNFLIIYRKIFCKNYRHTDDFYVNGITKKFLELNACFHFDAVIVNYFYFSKVLDFVPTNKKGLMTHDSFSMYPKGHKAIFYLSKKNERKALIRASHIFAVQDLEAEYFKSLVPERKILTTYIKIPFVEQELNFNHNIVFLSGASDFNKGGIVWFIQKVLPDLITRFKDVKLRIAGSICSILSEYESNSHIELVGRVDNPADFFATADIAINPTFHGTGLKIKTIESLSFGKVTLTSLHSSLGLFKKNTSPIISSDKSTEWTFIISSLWNNSDMLISKRTEIRSYIHEMNNFIDKQYETFLKVD